MKRENKNDKNFTFVLKSGNVVNKFGKNIEVYKNGVYFIEDKIFVSSKDILEIIEYEAEKEEVN